MGVSLIPRNTGIAKRGNDTIELSKWEAFVVGWIADGGTSYELARQMSRLKGSSKKDARQTIRNALKRRHVQDALAEELRVEVIAGLGGGIMSLVRKARAGRVDAIKLMFEASNFYNPRVDHNHGGEIAIVIKNAPRPERMEEVYIGDAEVVE